VQSVVTNFFSETPIFSLEDKVHKEALIQHPMLADPNDHDSVKIKQNVCCIHGSELMCALWTWKSPVNEIIGGTGNTHVQWQGTKLNNS